LRPSNEPGLRLGQRWYNGRRWRATRRPGGARRRGGGNAAAREIASRLGEYAEHARFLARALYRIAGAPRHGWTQKAPGYNNRVAAGPEIRKPAPAVPGAAEAIDAVVVPVAEAPLAVRELAPMLDFNTAADEAAYAAWAAAHSAGFVINAPQTRRGRVMLHRARCSHIRSAPGWPAITAAKRKICAEDPAELEAWAAALGGSLDFCQSCDPVPGRPPRAAAVKRPTGAEGDFPPLLLTRKNGAEPLRGDGAPGDATVTDFWRWAMSDLIGNTARGVLAEYIVARALGLTSGARIEWDAYDLKTPGGVKIEVKSAAYLQSWYQKKLSRIVFSIRPARAWDATTNELDSLARRQADIYVFCLLKHKDKATIDPLDLDQWEFYVVRTADLNARYGAQRGLALSSLLTLAPRRATYKELAACVEELSDANEPTARAEGPISL
jgi:hypothetical protein